MFNQIQTVSFNWVSEQRSLLADAQLLFQNINSDFGAELQKFIENLSSLDSINQDSFFKDHICHNWLNETKTEVLNVYENSGYKIDFEKLNGILSLMNLAVAVLSEKEYQFTIKPKIFSKFLLPVSGLHFDFNLIEMWVLSNKIIPVNYTNNIEEIIEDVILENTQSNNELIFV